MYTHIRVRKTDYEKIKSLLSELKKSNTIGTFSQPDVVTKLLESYEKINQTNDKSRDCVEKVLSNSDV
jgi:hypothetical protein